MATTMNIREKQIASITQMLNLNEPKTSESKKQQREPVWKILIYDRVGMEILTPLFTVQELRANGITLHVPLHSPDRTTPIPDTPAIYFILPTQENIRRLATDIQNNLYGNYYLNFIRPVNREMIEDIASAVLQSGDPKCVTKVYDQYVDFVALEDNLVVMETGGECDYFYDLNKSNTTDSEMNEILQKETEKLFALFATINAIPIIKTARTNSAAEIIAEKLDKKIRENIRDARASLFQTATSRPLLIIYDRAGDIATPLAHSWTYQSLAHDVLETNLNVVKWVEEEGGSRNNKSFAVDTRRDEFWKGNRGLAFPSVAEAIQSELEDYRKAEEGVKRLGEDRDDIGGNNVRLCEAMRGLPALLERKRVLDGHTSIATALLSQIKSRNLDNYYEIESKLLISQKIESINQILLDPNMGNFQDKIRLYLIYYLSNHGNMSDSEAGQFLESLRAFQINGEGVDESRDLLKAVDYVRKWISYSKMTLPSNQPTNPSYHQQPTQQNNMFSKLVNSSSFLMEGVRNFVFKRQDLPLTKLTLELLENSGDEKTVRIFDPKQLSNKRSNHGNATNFHEIFVYVVGGGNYVEYQNLVDCFRNLPGKGVSYGASCLYNGGEFLGQLVKLGREIG